MTQISLFETPLWMYQLDLNTDEIESDARQYCSTIPSSVRSNEGGFQGNDYFNEHLFEEIGSYIPQLEDKPLSSYKIHSWVNINKPKDYNTRHTHLNTNIFLCGN